MDDIYSAVLSRLETLGVDGISDDDSAIDFAIGRAKENLLNDIKHEEVPDGLRYTFINMVCGYYLHDLKAMGQISVDVLDLSSAPAKQIKEGEVQITFAGPSDGSLTPEARFDQLVQSLIHPDPVLLAKYRKVVWL